MDWPKARGILLIAFALVNLVLAYSIWGPTGLFPEMAGPPHQQQVQQIRATLAERGFELAAAVPTTPGPLPFLRVEYSPTVEYPKVFDEPSGGTIIAQEKPKPRAFEGWGAHPEPTIDMATQAIVYYPLASGSAARQLRLEDQGSVVREVHDYLRMERLLPTGAQYAGIYPKAADGRLVVEYVPMFQQYPVYSGYVRAEVSARGVETVTHFWVRPQRFKEGSAKAVRPAAEALLRLVGHLERTDDRRRVITDIRLGYYAGRGLTALQSGVINGWDTVPVWRIGLASGEIFFVNAFNGELES